MTPLPDEQSCPPSVCIQLYQVDLYSQCGGGERRRPMTLAASEWLVRYCAWFGCLLLDVFLLEWQNKWTATKGCASLDSVLILTVINEFFIFTFTQWQWFTKAVKIHILSKLLNQRWWQNIMAKSCKGGVRNLQHLSSCCTVFLVVREVLVIQGNWEGWVL